MMRTRSQDVTEILRGWILDGTMPAGERLEEVPLAERLGVSRTPLRAALTLLATERLLDYQPKRGYVVRRFGADDVFAAYEVRASIEGLACRLAAANGVPDAVAATLRACLAEGDRILSSGALAAGDLQPYQAMNERFHDAIIQLSGNPWVERFVRQTHAIPFVSGRVILWHDYGVIRRSHDDHHRILAALVARDPARAEDLMREHVYFAGLFLRDNFDRVQSKPGEEPARSDPPEEAPR
ncbi:GntR family transcriptional regulator (plasmid) [Methylobacterium currus]|uniref:GntR family transcriptional regulator n=1 Tax=Methylobacterium currus TaxID=2051553 RepID=UPI001E2B7B55|nr:GntR family transcriptional regulator [Methylobacterium currus]UHC19983.1 GntR family transcriptional regulator [Methylobacterium currus]